MYVPAFFETFLVMLVALAVLEWVRRRAPAAGTVMPLLVIGVALSTLWGGAAVLGERTNTVATARYAAMGIAVVGLVGSLVWAVLVRGRPALGGDEPDQPA